MLAPTMATKKPAKKTKTSSKVRAASAKKEPEGRAEEEEAEDRREEGEHGEEARRKEGREEAGRQDCREEACSQARRQETRHEGRRRAPARRRRPPRPAVRGDAPGEEQGRPGARSRRRLHRSQGAYERRAGRGARATWVATATSGEDENEETFNQNVPEDAGGPFVTTTAGQEFAEEDRSSNPKRSKREPFPRT